ncbi:MAG: nitroreductase family protein [Victivallales bacterium]|nr:nitroreductase family protein [Victivallales bacterium]
MNQAETFLETVKNRTSCRNYLDEDLSDEEINFCLEAARLAPSACNKQPWRFIVVKDLETRTRICRDGLLPGIPMPWLKTVPVIIALCAERATSTHRLAPLFSGVNYELIDCGIAGEHLVLAAETLGLGSCWIGWFKPGKIRRLLKLPRSLKPVSLISLGRPEKKTEPRSRLELKNIARINKW